MRNMVEKHNNVEHCDQSPSHLHQVGELRVPEGNVRRLGRQRGEDVGEAAERLVDVLCLLQPLGVAARARSVQPLAPRQVNQMKHALMRTEKTVL